MVLPDDYLSVETPENVSFGYQVAGIGSRFLAALVDSLIILVLQVLVGLLILLPMNSLLRDTELPQTWIWVAAALGLLAFAFFWGYYIFFEMIWNGQSPGKRWAGLRVIRADGTPITLSESIIRNLIRVIDFLPTYYGIGVITMFIDAQSRRLGDLAAGTLVVRERPPASLESPSAPQYPSHMPESLPSPIPELPLGRLTASDIQAAEEFLQRRETFSNRKELAGRLAANLLERMGLPPDAWADDEAEALLMHIVQASRNRDI